MALLRCSLGSKFLLSFTTALSLCCCHLIIELFCRVSGALWTLSVHGAGDLQFSGCHQRSGLLLLHCLSNLQQQCYCLPTDANPGTKSHLCPTVRSSPSSWLPQIQSCSVMWSEWGQNFCPSWAEVCCGAVSRNSTSVREDLSPPCLRGKSMCVLPMSRVWDPHSPSVSPKSSNQPRRLVSLTLDPRTGVPRMWFELFAPQRGCPHSPISIFL